MEIDDTMSNVPSTQAAPPVDVDNELLLARERCQLDMALKQSREEAAQVRHSVVLTECRCCADEPERLPSAAVGRSAPSSHRVGHSEQTIDVSRSSRFVRAIGGTT